MAILGVAPAFGQTAGPTNPNANVTTSPLIIISIDKSSYTLEDTIVISGQVQSVVAGTPVSIQIFDPNYNIVQMIQVDANSDGKYLGSIPIKSTYWKSNGTYTIKVQYGPPNVTAQTTFAFVTNNQPISTIHPLQFGGQTYNTHYIILKTDKQSYFQSNKIIFSGTVAVNDTTNQINLIITGPQGNYIDTLTTTPNTDGSFQIVLDTNIPKMQNEFSQKGTYSAVAFVKTRSSSFPTSFDYSPVAPPPPRPFSLTAIPTKVQNATQSWSKNATEITPSSSQMSIINKTSQINGQTTSSPSHTSPFTENNGQINTTPVENTPNPSDIVSNTKSLSANNIQNSLQNYSMSSSNLGLQEGEWVKYTVTSQYTEHFVFLCCMYLDFFKTFVGAPDTGQLEWFQYTVKKIDGTKISYEDSNHFFSGKTFALNSKFDISNYVGLPIFVPINLKVGDQVYFAQKFNPLKLVGTKNMEIAGKNIKVFEFVSETDVVDVKSLSYHYKINTYYDVNTGILVSNEVSGDMGTPEESAQFDVVVNAVDFSDNLLHSNKDPLEGFISFLKSLFGSL